ncbi:hypothetical protein JXQ70_10155 [bacterium]|nr:hypothetical protein [bacterium]
MKGPIIEIERGLARIRLLRRLFLFILFSYLPILVLIMGMIERTGSWFPILLPICLFFLGMYVQHKLQRIHCPRCHDFFFVQKVTKENYTPYSSFSFPPQKRCQKCGLVLYK